MARAHLRDGLLLESIQRGLHLRRVEDHCAMPKAKSGDFFLMEQGPQSARRDSGGSFESCEVDPFVTGLCERVRFLSTWCVRVSEHVDGIMRIAPIPSGLAGRHPLALLPQPMAAGTQPMSLNALPMAGFL